VNPSEIQLRIEPTLRHAAARFGDCPRPEPLAASPWVAMSTLQKAIRRGREDLALRAAATLMRDAPDRLWRRLGCVACEDIGLGDLEAVAIATAALGGVRKRAELGGDWPIAGAVVAGLACAPKCRVADDLLMICELCPAYARQRDELQRLSVGELVGVVCGSAPIEERAVALWCALGGGPRRLGLRRPRSETQTVFDRLCEAGWPSALVEVARINFNRTGEPLGPLVALAAREPVNGSRVEADEIPPELMINGTPGWAFDLYTREGRAVYARFLAADSRSAAWLRRYVAASRRVAVLGHCVFRVEGGLVDRRVHWPLADRLREQADVSCAGPGCGDVSELLDLVRQDLTRLNGVRSQTLGRDDHCAYTAPAGPH